MRSSVGAMLLRRVGGMVAVMFCVATVVFAIAHIIPGDPAAGPVLLRTSGREKGGTLYLAREILDAALEKAHLPIGTPARDLIVMRKVVGGRRHIAQVLLEIRVRKEAGT